jgi:hypothetical protein
MHRRTPLWVLVAVVAGGCWAETGAPAQAVTAEDLRDKPWQLWNQVELEYGLAHYDQVFPGATTIRAGPEVRPLAPGPPISDFAEGTEGGAQLEQFITEQRVAGMLVLQDGRIRLERYALGHTGLSPWTSQSVAKSVTSTLVGIAVHEGYIKSLDDPVSTYIEGLKGSPYDEVNVEQLLTMTSGVGWVEDYTDPQSDLGRLYATGFYPVFADG